MVIGADRDDDLTLVHSMPERGSLEKLFVSKTPHEDPLLRGRCQQLVGVASSSTKGNWI